MFYASVPRIWKGLEKTEFESTLNMWVSFITRILILVLGYAAYPAYDCYKALGLDDLQMEQLRFWCQYWILLAFMTASGTVTDCALSWLPMYGEAKLALLVYLWHPNTMASHRRHRLHTYSLRPNI
ncbi:hypothetical protein EJB05_48546, partial [Eragrostis curvula]